MKNQNICKFIPSGTSNLLHVQNFVYETDLEIMSEPVTCAAHRAVLVTRGEGLFFCGAGSWHGGVGTLLFFFSGETVRVQEAADLEYIYVSFSGERGDDLFRRFAIHGENRVFEGFDQMIPMWKESLLRASEENIDICAESMLLYALSRLSAANVKMNQLVQKMISITEQRFTEPSFSIGYLSETLGYNNKYISHVFKKKMGVNYTEYLRTMRIRYAVTLLDHGIDSVKSVAYLCGFRDPFYFSTVFKKIVGYAPSSYRSNKE